MFAKAAFGAIAGTIVGLLLDPLLDAIPPIPILTGFVDSLASEILTIALTAAGALISTRVQRLDHFIAEHASRIAVTTSLLLVLGLWVNAGMPATVWALVASAATGVSAALILAFCGWIIRTSMQSFTPEQAREAEVRREGEASRIAEEAIAAGDPQLATGIFSLDLAGRIGQAYATACLGLVLLPLLTLAAFAAAALDAHFLYGIGWSWSLVTGAIIAAAGIGVLGVSEKVGRAHADRVPLDEKYEDILPSRTDVEN